MTGRERLLAALNNEEADRLPFAPLVDDYFISSLPEQGIQYNLIEALNYIECDILERHVPGNRLIINGVERYSKTHGDITRSYYETPVGTIYAESRRGGKTNMITKHLIETPEDAKIFQYVCENTTYKIDNDGFKKRDDFIGRNGMATLSGPMSPIQDILQFLCGVENTVYLLADEPVVMEELMDAMHNRHLKAYASLAEVDCPVVFSYEDTSTTVMSKDMFVRYSAPCINDYAKILHNNGKLYITHMCGKLTGFANEIASLDMDGIDSVCPPTTGDLYPWDARRYFGNKVIIGGIEPPSLTRMDERQTLITVIEIVKKMPTCRGFILSTGDAVPYGTPIESLKIISKLIKHLGSASLTGNFDENIIEQILLS